MKLRARIVAVSSLAVACLGVLTFGVARAQQGAAAAVGGTTAELRKPVNLSLDEMNKEGDKSVGRVEMNATAVRRMLEKARTERDVVKTLCLNDKLNQLDVTLRSSRERKTALEAAVARKQRQIRRQCARQRLRQCCAFGVGAEGERAASARDFLRRCR